MTRTPEQIEACFQYSIAAIWDKFDDCKHGGHEYVEQLKAIGAYDHAETMQNCIDRGADNDREKESDYNEGISAGARLDGHMQMLRDTVREMRENIEPKPNLPGFEFIVKQVDLITIRP